MSSRRSSNRARQIHQRCGTCKMYSPGKPQPVSWVGSRMHMRIDSGHCMAVWPLHRLTVTPYSVASDLGCKRYLKAPEKKRRRRP